MFAKWEKKKSIGKEILFLIFWEGFYKQQKGKKNKHHEKESAVILLTFIYYHSFYIIPNCRII